MCLKESSQNHVILESLSFNYEILNNTQGNQKAFSFDKYYNQCLHILGDRVICYNNVWKRKYTKKE